MDLIGDIVEREVEAPVAPSAATNGGFPDLGKLRLKKASRWSQANKTTQGLRGKENKRVSPARKEPAAQKEPANEAERIHRENMAKIAQLTENEIQQERDELLAGLDPLLVKSLLARTEKRIKQEAEASTEHGHKHAEGFDGWVGGGKEGRKIADFSHLDAHDVDKALGLKDLLLLEDLREEQDPEKDPKNSKTVRFSEVATINYEDVGEDVELDPNGWEDIEDINDLVPHANLHDQVAHDDYQLLTEEEEQSEGATVHFPTPKPKSNDLDLNDPEFFDKLHEKYYPELPKETHKLSWMTEPLPQNVVTTYESISDMRFDFKGDIVQLDDQPTKKEIPVYLGLHHHSENPQLAGYTLAELLHLSRSVVPAQRCFSIQMLGRILHKLGLHKYSIITISEDEEISEFNSNLKEMAAHFEKLVWGLIGDLRIIESITEAADEKKTKNLSVRNYAIEALWLWKEAGGGPAQETEADAVAREVQK